MFTFNRFSCGLCDLASLCKDAKSQNKNCFKTYFDIAPSIDNN